MVFPPCLYEGYSMIFKTTVFCGLAVFMLTGGSSNLLADEIPSAIQKKLYKKHCKRCHASDGTGQKDGKPLQIVKALKLTDKPELLDIVRQESKKKSDEELLKIIREGKGKMKGFHRAAKKKKKLSEEEAKMMLEYTRYLQLKAK